jgi:chromosome segregation ATPase
MDSLAIEQAAVVAKRDECQAALGRLWDPLKANEYTGSEWRAREKTISELMKLLQEWCEIPESLARALPAAIKTKTKERGEFAMQSLEAGEAAHNEHLAELSARIAGFDTENAQRAAAVTTAESALAVAEAAKEKAWQESTARQNEWADAEGIVNDLRRKQQVLGFSETEATEAVAATNGALEDLREVSERLVALRDQSLAGVHAVTTAGSDEAATAEATEGDASVAAAAEE